MGLLGKLKETVANAMSGGAALDTSTLPPEQRAAIEARMAEAQRGFEQGRAVTDAQRGARIFTGAAAAFLYGADHEWYPPSPAELERIRAEQGMMAMIKASQPPQGLGARFGDALKDTVGVRNGPAEIGDPDERTRVATAERAARDAARAPYRAEGLPAMTISRIATHGDSQIEELLAFLRQSGLAARPDLVWGVYRVPDRIDPMINPSTERGRVVEWDVVHVPGQLPAAPHDATTAFFSSRQRWISRRLGESSVLDEDLARIYAAHAGIGPQDCLGAARFLLMRDDGREEGGFIQPWVEGVHVFHRPTPRAERTMEELVASAPMPLDLDRLPADRVEVLEWAEIARIVQPQAQHLARVPSPVPSLPSTPQELLRAYLEVVGVLPTDCWSAQVTVDHIAEVASSTAFVTHNTGPKLPCADGEERRRLHGAQCVVVAYRDRPEYVAGRERWAAYQRDVLEARLDDASERRPPIQRLDFDSALVRAALAPARALEWLQDIGATQPPPVYRYCWPPVDA